ncbi:MAG TPA: acetyltransferase [Sphingobacteriaceae bacterium]
MYLYGASGHAKVIIDILLRNGQSIKALIDDNRSVQELYGYSVIHNAAEVLHAKTECIISIGNNKVRKLIAEKWSFTYIIAIEPSAQISRGSTIESGTVVMANVAVNAGSYIGKHCILNTNCSIDHDCVLEDYVHISPNVALAGNISVGEGTHIGIGACVIQGIRIGKWATVGAGTVIIKDVPDYAVVTGNPGKVIRYNNQDEE